MRALAVLKELLIELFKIFLRPFFVRENFDNLLPFHHLFHKALFLGKGRLLGYHIFRAAAADLFHNERHRKRRYHHHQKQPKTVSQHQKYRRHQRERATEHRRQTLSDKLTGGVRIVGVRTHNIAVRVRIKVFDRQFLHFRKHIGTQMVQHTLCDRRHRSCIDKRCQNYHAVHRDHHNNQAHQLVFNRRRHAAKFHRRRNNFVHDRSHEHRRNQTADRAQCNTQNRKEHTPLIIAEHRFQQAFECALFNHTLGYGHTPTAHRAFGHNGFSCRRLCHYKSPPSPFSLPLVCAS